MFHAQRHRVRPELAGVTAADQFGAEREGGFELTHPSIFPPMIESCKHNISFAQRQGETP